jgi:hypothetical protein
MEGNPMPHELRKIYFHAVDLTHAIESYRLEKPQFLPQGKIHHVEIMPDHLLVRIELKYVDNTHLLDYQIEFDKLVDVMIPFCVEHRIPLPAAGSKVTYAEGDEVVMEIVLTEEAVSNTGKPGDWSRLRGVG